MLVHRRAGKFVVPLDVELRAVRNRPALSRRGVLSRRPARDRRLIVRQLVLLPPHHGQRRLVLPPGRLVRLRRVLRRLRFKRLADLLVPPALFFSFIGLARGGLLLFLLLLQALLPALLPLDGQRVFALQLFLLPRVAQRVLLLPALPHLHAEIIRPFGYPHADPAERESRERHQRNRRREDEHDHAAPNVQPLIQRPRQQRADEAAALAIQRAHRERARQKRAVARLRAVRRQRRVHAGNAEKLEHGLHKQKNQRAEDQRSGAQLSFAEEHQHHARPADHHRQQQAEHAAQPAHNQHAPVEETAV